MAVKTIEQRQKFEFRAPPPRTASGVGKNTKFHTLGILLFYDVEKQNNNLAPLNIAISLLRAFFLV